MEKRENDEKDESEVMENESNDTISSLAETQSDVGKTKADIEYERDLEEAIKLSLQADEATTSNVKNSEQIPKNPLKSKEDVEFGEDLAKAIRLSLQNEASTSKEIISNDSFTFEADENFLSDSSDDTADSDLANRVLASAKNYMTEYSGLPPSEILKIINGNSKITTKDCKTITESVVKKTSEPNKGKINFKKLLNQKSKPETGNSDKTNNNNTSLKPIETASISENLFEDVPTSNEVELISDSDSNDDFEEVTSKSDGKTLEIKFEKVSELDDDLFSDIFADKNTNNKDSNNLQAKLRETADQIVENPVVRIESPKDALESLNENDKEIEVIQEISKDGVNNKTNRSELLKDILKPKSKDDKAVLTTEELKAIRNDVVQEKNQLIAERSAKERLASNITEQMCLEAQVS